MSGFLPSADADLSQRFAKDRFTVALIKPLISEMLERASHSMNRCDIDAAVLNAYAAGGGVLTLEPKYVFKKALAQLKQSGKAINHSQGVWSAGDSATLENSSSAGVESEDQDTDDTAELEPDSLLPDILIGTGSGSVYAYYFPAYRELAGLKQEKPWPLKIGFSDSAAIPRVIGQTGTALCEPPHVALVLKTDEPRTWEKLLHRILAIRGKKIETAPGNEWYLTTPEEILAIVTFVDSSVTQADIAA